MSEHTFDFWRIIYVDTHNCAKSVLSRFFRVIPPFLFRLGYFHFLGKKNPDYWFHAQLTTNLGFLKRLGMKWEGLGFFENWIFGKWSDKVLNLSSFERGLSSLARRFSLNFGINGQKKMKKCFLCYAYQTWEKIHCFWWRDSYFDASNIIES